MKYGIYIDFDNIIGGLKVTLGIKDKDINTIQEILFPIILKGFLQNLRIYNILTYRIQGNVLFKKAFSEFHNLQIKSLLRTEPQIFLNNIGIKPINPFVVHSGSKNKNAADISLTLEVINDLILKKIPLDAVVLCSGDIDFYPLISWIKEHTGKQVYLISFADRINSRYFDIFSHLMSLENILYAEYFLLETLKTIIELNVLKTLLKEEDLNRLCENLIDLESWIAKIIDGLQRRGEKPLYRAQLYYLFKTDLENDTLLNLYDNLLLIKQYCENNKKTIDICSDFNKKVIKGLKNWLKKHDKASTGLIIKNWFPQWKLNMSEEEANECLKKLIESGELEKEGFRFEESIEEGKPIGDIIPA